MDREIYILLASALSFVLVFVYQRLTTRINTISKVLYRQEKRIEELETKQKPETPSDRIEHHNKWW